MTAPRSGAASERRSTSNSRGTTPCTPPLEGGYNRQNPLRVESAMQAAEIDALIAAAWAKHPRRFEVAASADVLAKVAHVIALVRNELPECCRKHPVAELGETEGACTTS